jgi:hypothetical protein
MCKNEISNGLLATQVNYVSTTHGTSYSASLSFYLLFDIARPKQQNQKLDVKKKERSETEQKYSNNDTDEER